MCAVSGVVRARMVTWNPCRCSRIAVVSPITPQPNTVARGQEEEAEEDMTRERGREGRDEKRIECNFGEWICRVQCQSADRQVRGEVRSCLVPRCS
jgi:hypothetical protein